MKTVLLIFTAGLFITGCYQPGPSSDNDWMLGPFVKVDDVNPILGPLDSTVFLCPVRDTLVHWEAKDVFNPAAVVRNGKIYLLYRAEDKIGKLLGTSRIGIAESENGLNFKRNPEPVLYPDNDAFKEFEWEGGCEDPRIVENDSGTYFMTYTAWNGDKPRLFVASSNDLFTWEKHGSVFTKAFDGKYVRIHSKSGSIVCKLKDNRLVATKIKGKYWMYFGDTDLFLAYSEDLINWTPVEKQNTDHSSIPDDRRDYREDLLPVLQPRKGKFDSELVEPGPPAMLTGKGILLIYNSKNSKEYGDTTLPDGTYAAGQALYDAANPEKLQDRTDNYFFKPEKPYEITGQVNNVCFVEGLAHFNGTWYLYYGTADSKIAVATNTPE
ncbi:MAG: glycosidase [Chlorobi bacterium]|nr:glycosidase [Chlorobiota bacterium]